MPDARAEVLARIRRSLADRSATRPAMPAPYVRLAPETDLVALFVERCRAMQATVDVCANDGEARAALAAIAGGGRVERARFSDRARAFGAPAETSRADDHAGHVGKAGRDALAAAEVGITVADYGIADTGTLVVLPSADEGRLASLLPPRHVAVVRASTLRADLWALIGEIDRDARLRDHSAMIFITGPSRTADIELTLTIGVHGPTAVHVIVLDDRDAPAGAGS